MRKIILIFYLLGMVKIALAQAYLPLSGGTLTGSLTGTSASFTSDVNTGTAGDANLNVGSGSNPFSTSGRTVIFSNGTLSSLFGLGVGGTNKGYVYHDGTDMAIVSANAGSKLKLFSNNTLALTLNSDQTSLFAGAVTVAGNIHSREINVTANAGGADFVFDEGYKLRTLGETEAFIKRNKHLPEIASAEEMVKNGIDLGEMNIKLLQKIEELTLYLIEQDRKFSRRIEELEEQVETLKK